LFGRNEARRMGEFSYRESGDGIEMPNWPHGPSLDPPEILRRVATAFRRAVIDRAEGDRWVEARISKAAEVYSGLLLEAEHALRGHTVLVSVADAAGPDAAWVRFYMTPDTGGFELHYEPPGAEDACRALARKLADVLGYVFVVWDGGEPAEPPADPDDQAAREAGLRMIRELLDSGASPEKGHAEPGAAADGGGE
jgi:hypothetical protein